MTYFDMNSEMSELITPNMYLLGMRGNDKYDIITYKYGKQQNRNNHNKMC